MERPLVTAVTHSTAEARITLTRPARQAGHRRPRAHRARRRERQRGHDHPERAAVGGPSGRHVVHGPARRPARRARGARARSRPSSASARPVRRPRWARSPIVGAGMKSHPGVAAKTFTVARRRGHEHRDDLHLADQDLLRRRARSTWRTPCASCTRRSSSAPTPCCPRTWRACTARGGVRQMRVAVVGATGAVGSTMLGVMRSARSRPTRSCRSRRSARRDAASTGRRDARRSSRSRRGDPGLRYRALLGRLRRERRVGAALCRCRGRGGRQLAPSGACTTTCRSWCPRSTPRRSTATRGSWPTPTARRCRRRGAQADPRRRRDRAGGDLELPGRVGHGTEGGRGAARPGAGAIAAEEHADAASIRTRSPSTCCRRSRPSRTATTTRPRSASDARDPQDPRRDEHRRLRHLRARAGVHRALRVGERADARAALARRVPRAARRVARPDRDRRPGQRALPDARSTRPGATMCWWAASGATPRTSVASTSGSWATTSARVRPRTRCSWPSS